MQHNVEKVSSRVEGCPSDESCIRQQWTIPVTGRCSPGTALRQLGQLNTPVATCCCEGRSEQCAFTNAPVHTLGLHRAFVSCIRGTADLSSLGKVLILTWYCDSNPRFYWVEPLVIVPNSSWGCYTCPFTVFLK